MRPDSAPSLPLSPPITTVLICCRSNRTLTKHQQTCMAGLRALTQELRDIYALQGIVAPGDNGGETVVEQVHCTFPRLSLAFVIELDRSHRWIFILFRMTRCMKVRAIQLPVCAAEPSSFPSHHNHSLGTDYFVTITRRSSKTSIVSCGRSPLISMIRALIRIASLVCLPPATGPVFSPCRSRPLSVSPFLSLYSSLCLCVCVSLSLWLCLSLSPPPPLSHTHTHIQNQRNSLKYYDPCCSLISFSPDLSSFRQNTHGESTPSHHGVGSIRSA